MTPTALIADDEPLLRERLVQLLAEAWPELEIVAMARNGREALAALDESHPRIAFLDIRMPGMTGLEVAQQCAGRNVHIVFATAFEEYAVKAFEAGAVDYLVKPFDRERIVQTVHRLRERVQAPAPDLSAWLAEFARQVNPSGSYLQWIRASVGTQVRLVPVQEVQFFQADDKYTRVVLPHSELLIRKSIKELLDELDPRQFVQIHRASLVNLQCIDHVQRTSSDYWELKLRGRDDVLRISRSYLHVFKHM